MTDKLEEFKKYREKMNERILTSGNVQIKRFFGDLILINVVFG